MKKRRMVGRLMKRVLAKTIGGRHHQSGGPDARSDNRKDAKPSIGGGESRIEYGDDADIVATDDLAVLVGLVGLKLGLEPRSRPLIVNHWATWCDGCIAELPALVKLRSATRDYVDFVGVGWEGFSGGGTPEDWVAQVDDVSRAHGLTWSTMVFEGSPEDLFEGLAITEHTVPQTWVYDAHGECILRLNGEITEADVASIVNRIQELE